MNKLVEIDKLLKEIANSYALNPNLSPDDISNYINCDNKALPLVEKHQSKFYNNKKDYAKKNIQIEPWRDFFVINTPNGEGKTPNLFELADGYKIYIPIEEKNIYDVSSKILDLIVKNKIPSQYKLRNHYSYDAITIRFMSSEDTQLVINYINNKLTKYLINATNPFIPQIGAINACVDGEISYNRVLAKLIYRYIKESKKLNDGNDFSSRNFRMFIDKEIKLAKGREKEYFYYLYGLDNKRKYQDFLIVAEIIRDNIEKDILLDDLTNRKKEKKITSSNNKEYTQEELENIGKKSLREIIEILKERFDSDPDIKNSVDHLHKVMIDYMINGELKYFTEYRDVRNIIKKYFSQELFHKYLIKLGNEALEKVTIDTRIRYGPNQVQKALSELQLGKIDSFTNVNGSRSELGLIIPKQLLSELSCEVVEKNDDDYLTSNNHVNRRR